jgi:Transglycosylase-like domain
LPDLAGRHRAVAAALLTAALLVSVLPAVATATAPPRLERFLYALGRVESGGSYTSRNSTSGAYGKYQIMPSSWAAWARQYLGSASAPQTRTNQEKVAHRKVTALYRWLRSWPAVAHWWLTGSSERNPARWSSFSRTYVNRVIALMGGVGSTAAGKYRGSSASWIDSHDTRLSEKSKLISYRLTWSTARHSAYGGDRVRYATRKGASATITFTGTGIAWIGPVGPTRGTARIYVDGKAVKSVNLRRSSFQARTLLFSKKLAAGEHTFRIVVTSRGRPVAIDELIIGT